MICQEVLPGDLHCCRLEPALRLLGHFTELGLDQPVLFSTHGCVPREANLRQIDRHLQHNDSSCDDFVVSTTV